MKRVEMQCLQIGDQYLFNSVTSGICTLCVHYILYMQCTNMHICSHYKCCHMLLQPI